jgi:hypothetical protein
MTGLCGLILPPDAAVGKPEPSSWRLLATKVGDRSAFCARNVDFAFLWTCFSHGFRSSAGTKEPLGPALDRRRPQFRDQAQNIGKEVSRDVEI